MTVMVKAGASRAVGDTHRLPGRQPAAVVDPSSADNKIDNSLPASLASPGRFLCSKCISYCQLAIITAEGRAMRQHQIVRRHHSGQSMVEFALILPLLMALLSGVVDF